MNAHQFEALHPKEYQRRFLREKVRVCGRDFDSVRSTLVSTGVVKSADGSALVKMGNTTVLCGLKLEVGRAGHMNPKEGRIEVEVGFQTNFSLAKVYHSALTLSQVHLTPVCSPKLKIGKSPEDVVACGEFISHFIVENKIVPLNELCIEEGKSVWVVYADITCLNLDGNVMDASLIAVSSALRNLRIPATVLDDLGEVMVDPDRSKLRPLPMDYTPIPLTFALVDQEVLADPSSKEEDLCTGKLTIVMNNKRQLCCVYKPGGAEISDKQLRACFTLTKERVETLYPIIAHATK